MMRTLVFLIRCLYLVPAASAQYALISTSMDATSTTVYASAYIELDYNSAQIMGWYCGGRSMRVVMLPIATTIKALWMDTTRTKMDPGMPTGHHQRRPDFREAPMPSGKRS
jgi:hypothetical protein